MSSFSSSFPTRHPVASLPQGPDAAGPVYGSTSSRMAPRLLDGRAPDQPQVSLGRLQHSFSHSGSQYPSSQAGSQRASSHQAAPRLQPSQHHQASTHASAPTDEASDEDMTPSDVSDCDSTADYQPSGSLFTSPRRNSTRRTAAGNCATQALSATSRPCVRWSAAEDKRLMSSVKKHGRNWEKVSAELTKAGGPKRQHGGLLQRYLKLKKQAEEQQEAAATTTRNSSAAHGPTQQSTTPSRSQGTTIATANGSWTPEEEQKLAEIARLVERRDACAEWRKAFPVTVRSDFAVLKRYDRTVKERRERAAEATQEEHLDEATQRAAGATASDSSGFAMPPTSQLRRGRSSAHAASTSTTHPSSSSGQCSGARENFSQHQYNGNNTTVPQITSGQHGHSSSFSGPEDDVIDLTTPSAAPSEQQQQQQALSPSPTDYTVTCHATGVLVENFPPLHHLLILAPGKCRVVLPPPSSSQAASLGSLDQHPQQELTTQQLASPFVFKIKADGSVQDVKLPLGTATHIVHHHAQRQMVGLDAQGQQVWETHGGPYVETVYLCEDGWEVVFRSPSV